MKNLFQLAIETLKNTPQWPVGHKMILATANGDTAYLYNDTDYIRLYVEKAGKLIRDGLTMAILHPGDGWLISHSATEQNYQAWAERIHTKPDEDKLMELARIAERRHPKLRLRPFKAAALVRERKVKQIGVNLFEVTSQTSKVTSTTSPTHSYTVDVEAQTCTCADFTRPTNYQAPAITEDSTPMCKHRIAALMYLKLQDQKP